MAVVYKHSKLNGEIFYIGISTGIKRPYSHLNRNKFWHNITNKYKYDINILFNNISYSEAIEIEKYLITYYGRVDKGTGSLINMTDGGEGVVGNIVSEEGRQRMSKSKMGEVWSEERRKNHKSGCTNRVLSKNARLMMSIHNAKTKSKKVIDTKTNIIYNTILDATICLGLNYSRTKAQLSGQNPNRTTLKILNNGL